MCDLFSNAKAIIFITYNFRLQENMPALWIELLKMYLSLGQVNSAFLCSTLFCLTHDALYLLVPQDRS